jgi:type VI secretion system secreted protein VgrG
VGHDIYTDRHGRVKVQFHWDRDGRFDEHTSVWMRVTQPWAGAGYGFQFFPRVGMEVLVTFLGGDPDRPVVLGSLYNGTHPTPEPLPERMTRSGIRTQSTPKGGGFNELSFDDARGTERVYLHAERDFDAVVNHSHELKVKHAHTLEVGTRQHVGVEGEQLVAVGGVQSTLVGQDQACCVGGSRRDRVVGNLASRIEGNAVEEVQGVALRKIQTHEIALTCGNRDLCIYGTSSTTVGHEAWVYVHEGAQVNTKRAIVVAEERLTLCVGDSLLTIAPDQITIEADRLVLNGRDSVQIRGTEVASQTPGGAMVHLREGNTLIRGSEVNLTTPEASGGPLDPATHPPNVKLQFTHLGVEHGGEPIANTTFIVTTPTRGGWEAPLRGTTNASGELELHVPDAVKRIEVVLAVNTTYADLYPGDRPLRFMVLLEDSLGEADNPKGARMRLRNLGYQPGVELDEEEIDAATRQALLDFQLEAEAPRTGELDDSTKRKLRDLYGS